MIITLTILVTILLDGLTKYFYGGPFIQNLNDGHAIISIIALAAYSYLEKYFKNKIFIGLILGGISGNLLDKWMGNPGITDWILIPYANYYANLADFAIWTGILGTIVEVIIRIIDNPRQPI